MDRSSDTRTSATLLELLRSDAASPAAWERFVERYGPLIHDWCRKWGAQPADADDITQLVLVKLLGRMRTFTYDRSQRFRGWLNTVVRNAWLDLASANGRNGDVLALQLAVGLLAIPEARDELEEWIDTDHRREVLKLAMDRVCQRVNPRTWQAFVLAAIEEKTGAEVADLLGMSIGAVFQGRKRIQEMIKEEIELITGADSI